MKPPCVAPLMVVAVMVSSACIFPTSAYVTLTRKDLETLRQSLGLLQSQQQQHQPMLPDPARLTKRSAPGAHAHDFEILQAWMTQRNPFIPLEYDVDPDR
jgi:hypothetical protein